MSVPAPGEDIEDRFLDRQKAVARGPAAFRLASSKGVFMIGAMEELAKKSRKAQGEHTRRKILDAAEKLFSDANYEAISLRDVAQEANVQLGLLSYYFKAKEGLFEAVVERRTTEGNAVRLAELRKHENPSLEQVMEAFLRPALEYSRNLRIENYYRLSLRVIYDPRWKDLVDRLFGALMNEFYAACLRSMPNTPPELVARGFVNTVSVLMGGIHRTSQAFEFSRPYSTDFENEYQCMLRFALAGMKDLAASDLPAPACKRPTSQRAKSRTKALEWPA